MKRQIIIIGGGDNFETYEEYLNFLRNFPVEIERYKAGKEDWKKWLGKVLSNEFDVIKPEMPNTWNAQFEEWKIWFEKFIPYLNDGVIFIGHSLGGSFLAKYLAINTFPKKIKAVFVVAGAFGDNVPEYKLLDFTPPEDLKNFESQVEKIFLYHSKDDEVVPFSDLEKFSKKLPNAVPRLFEDRGHFIIEEFPELLEDIKSLYF